MRHLHAHGPQSPALLAEALGVRDARVSTALRSLVARDRAAVAGRDGRRVLYVALGDPDTLRWGQTGRARTDPETLGGRTTRDPAPADEQPSLRLQPRARACKRCSEPVLIIPRPEARAIVADRVEVLPLQTCPTCRGTGVAPVLYETQTAGRLIAGTGRARCAFCRGTGIVGEDLRDERLLALDAAGRVRITTATGRAPAEALHRLHLSCSRATIAAPDPELLAAA